MSPLFAALKGVIDQLAHAEIEARGVALEDPIQCDAIIVAEPYGSVN